MLPFAAMYPNDGNESENFPDFSQLLTPPIRHDTDAATGHGTQLEQGQSHDAVDGTSNHPVNDVCGLVQFAPTISADAPAYDADATPLDFSSGEAVDVSEDWSSYVNDQWENQTQTK